MNNNEHSLAALPFIIGSIFGAVLTLTASAVLLLLVFPSLSANNSSAISQINSTFSTLQQTSVDISEEVVKDGITYEKIRLDDGSSYLIEKSPLTKEEEAIFGHVECEQITPENFVKLGQVKVGKTNYTWCDDSVLDFTFLKSKYELSVQDGVYKDAEGYVACYSRINPFGDIVETPIGQGKVYDYSGDWLTIGVFVSASLSTEDAVV